MFIACACAHCSYGFRAQGSGLRAQGFGCRGSGFGCRVQGIKFKDSVLGFRVYIGGVAGVDHNTLCEVHERHVEDGLIRGFGVR